MKTIKTNLSRISHFVMTDDNDRIIAIVNVPQDEQDITEKVLEAIKDDCKPNYVELISELYIDPTATCHVISFDVEIKEELGDEPYTSSFYLEITEVY